ncbi:PPA1309 family protein [Luteipulveratus mongoliensis]|nr:PPA1309 family protein [Luteipulveratus mongoliensis]
MSCAVDTEQHVAAAGWDQPPRLFAIARNGDIARREPALAKQLARVDPDAYSTIEQEGMPSTSSLDSMLGRLAWPDEVDGVALAVERIVVPPEAERDLPDDPEKAAEALAVHPDHEDVRLLVAVLRDGESVCLLRQRKHDSDDKVAIGKDIAPGLVEALRATFS